MNYAGSMNNLLSCTISSSIGTTVCSVSWTLTMQFVPWDEASMSPTLDGAGIVMRIVTTLDGFSIERLGIARTVQGGEMHFRSTCHSALRNRERSELVLQYLTVTSTAALGPS